MEEKLNEERKRERNGENNKKKFYTNWSSLYPASTSLDIRSGHWKS
jgi:hypothetical protein